MSVNGNLRNIFNFYVTGILTTINKCIKLVQINDFAIAGLVLLLKIGFIKKGSIKYQQ